MQPIAHATHNSLQFDPYSSTHLMDRFLVCGLGSLGQNCVNVLRRFGVHISAIDLNRPLYWDVEALPEFIEDLIIGDCRNATVLEKCQIRRCRSIILATNDERVNIETAFIARLKNPDVRLVLRSAQPNLNRLLSDQLGNFVAFEPTRISSTAFALAALGDEKRGFFYLKNQLVQVSERKVTKNDSFLHKSIEEIHRNHRIISHCRKDESFSKRFFQWQPEHKVEEGDHLLVLELTHKKKRIEISDRFSDQIKEELKERQINTKGIYTSLKDYLSRKMTSLTTKKTIVMLWRDRLARLATICFSILVVLLIIGSILFFHYGPGLNVTDSIYAAVSLMLGGYFDLLGGELKFNLPIPWWLRFFGLLQTITGTVLVGALYALITSYIMATNFNFTKRPRFPDHEHIVVIGWGRIGRRVTDLLSEFRQSFIVITKEKPRTPSNFPIISVTEDTGKALSKVHMATAKAIISVTNDEMTNLELGLMAHRINPLCRIVLRTYHQRFGSYVSSLFSYAHVICSSALSAEAFAAAAFGENIHNLFVQNGQTILVTQYTIENNDTLNGLILAEATYGYEIVPIVMVQHHSKRTIWLPSENTRLNIGDELTVLATIESLHRIEKGDRHPASWELMIHKVSSEWAKEEGSMLIVRSTGCTLGDSRKFLNNLPGRFPKRLYHHQGQRLLNSLNKMGFEAELLSCHISKECV
jgi:Trk K+ transport system NAD-binding subunit